MSARWQLEQPDTSAWFSSASSSSGVTTVVEADTSTELQRRYAEALWLGEFHTSLDDFLDYAAQWVHLDTAALVEVLTALSQLVRPRSIVRQRHMSAIQVLKNRSTSACVEQVSNYEVTLLERIARHGPAARLVATNEDEADAAAAYQWSQAMESREFQLQILIILFLLQVASCQPKAVEEARETLTGKTGNSVPEPQPAVDSHEEGSKRRRRQRKLDKPKRWQGGIHDVGGPESAGSGGGGGEGLDGADDFAWIRRPRKRHFTGMSLEDTGGDGEQEDVLEMQGGQILDVDHLSRRLEALTDILCLSQVTAGMMSVDLLADVAITSSDKGSAAAAGDVVVYFGSAVRKVAQHDDMDDAQWLCARVVEPRFGTTLPRQCALFRSKCFVSLQTATTTPARPSRPKSRPHKERNPSTTLVGQTSSTTSDGLSHVLEREQAGRMQLMRARAGAAPSTLLGRGREVDMTRRLARSVSASSALLKLDDSTLPSNPATNVASQRSFSGILPSSSSSSLSQRTHRKPLVTQRKTSSSQILAVNSPRKAERVPASNSRLLVLSTPQKSRSLMRDNSTRLLLPETPPQHHPQRSNLGIGGGKGLVNRSASFGGLFQRPLRSRSPSPIVFGSSDPED